MTHTVQSNTASSGEVPATAELMARLLQRLGHKVTIAYYATLTDEPDLVVPSWHLLGEKTKGSVS